MSDPYERLRPLLQGIAYRMLGSATEAEDVVQEAFLRHHRAVAAGTRVQDDRAFLTTTVTRLAIDALRSARARRERYPGPWLPEPVLTDLGPGPDERAERRETLSLAFLVLLERLSPVERAVVVLRDAFDLPYDEIAAVVEREEANCRQIAARARRRLDDAGARRFDAAPARQEELTDRFLAACAAGDLEGLVALLAEDAAAYTDGGGRARAASRPVVGRDAVARFMALISSPQRAPAGLRIVAAEINGERGRVAYDGAGRPVAALVLGIAGDRIAAVQIVANPEKLGALTGPA